MPGDRFIELALAEDRHVLDVLFRDAREAVTVQDRAGRLVYANDKAAELVGMSTGLEMVSTPLADLVARFEMLDEAGAPLAVDALPGRRVLAGLDAPEITIGYRLPGSPRVRWSRVNASPIKNDAGEVVWALNFFLDITEQMRDRDVNRILAAVSEVFASSLTIRENLTQLANLLVEEMADWCSIHLIDEGGDLVPAAASISRPDEAVALHIAVDPERIPPGSDQILARVFDSGHPELITATDQDMLLDESISAAAEAMQLVSKAQIDSVVCVALGTRNAPLGVITVARARAVNRFDAFDVTLMERIGERAGVALANARLYEMEHETAEALRSGLAPATIPRVEGLTIAARYVPLARLGHVGGDFYDVIPLSEKNTVVLVGDIEGKGVPAAAAVGVARDTLRATVKLQPDSRVVLAQLNDAMHSLSQPRMCTLAYILLDRLSGGFEARVTLAGHPAPILLSPDGEVSLLGVPCPPAGVLTRIEPHETLTTLRSGDTLLVYTDGFALSHETPMATASRYLEGGQMESPDALLDRLLASLRSDTESIRDDILLVAIRVW